MGHQSVKSQYATLLVAIQLLFGCNRPESFPLAREELKVVDDDLFTMLIQLSPIPPVPHDRTNEFCDRVEAVDLGRQLFFDQGFSNNSKVSCATCHNPVFGFTTRESTAKGLSPTFRNAPTVLNVSHNRWYAWDGSSDVLWAQSVKPIEHPLEHGFTRRDVLRRFHTGDYAKTYFDVFGVRLPPVNCDENRLAKFYADVGKALAAFQSTLNSGTSRFDRFVAQLRATDNTVDPDGESILTDSEVRGLKLFFGKANCVLCHNGPLFTDMEFHNVRVPPKSVADPLDSGRFSGVEVLLDSEFGSWTRYAAERGRSERPRVKKSGQLWGQFKTPSLRDVTRTGPYMHNGVFSSLADVVNHYSTFEKALPPGHHEETILKPLNLTENEKVDLISFLGTLESINYCGDIFSANVQ
ncbi:cytochrome-c peroxidase [Novipirellula caenicola]|uniref:Cytochrome c domain-containing protein n=1 Tax=Novipirellula caenicola TaxID=1536901 RepID=A0ABP9VW34_9BACT